MEDIESIEKYKKILSLKEELKNCKDSLKALQIQMKLVDVMLDAMQDYNFKKFLAKQSLMKSKSK